MRWQSVVLQFTSSLQAEQLLIPLSTLERYSEGRVDKQPRSKSPLSQAPFYRFLSPRFGAAGRPLEPAFQETIRMSDPCRGHALPGLHTTPHRSTAPHGTAPQLPLHFSPLHHTTPHCIIVPQRHTSTMQLVERGNGMRWHGGRWNADAVRRWWIDCWRR